MTNSWLYKQINYRNSLWNKTIEFLLFQVIPFVVISIMAAGIVLGLSLPVVMLTQ